FYFAYPHRVKTLVLAHTFPSFGALGEAFVSQFVATRLKPLLEGGSPADSAAATVQTLLAADASNEARDHFHRSLCELRKDSYIRTITGLVNQPAPGPLKNIRVPTLVLPGEHDRLSQPSLAHVMSARIAHSQVHIIPNCGHLSNLEKPTHFNSVVHEFI